MGNKMNIKKRDKIYQILKAISDVKCCETDCPLYYFCDECEGVCNYLEGLSDKLIDEEVGGVEYEKTKI